MGRPRLILLLRHGESESNCDKNVNRYTANHKVRLTTKGMEQAERAGNELSEMISSNENIAFYTSPYLRTRETTAGVLRGLKNTGWNGNVNIIEEPRLREQDFGNFQGSEQERKQLWTERAKYGHFFYRLPQGESAADVYDRCSSFNETLWRRINSDNCPPIVILVTHGLAARVWLQRWFRWSVELFEDLQNVNNCQWIVLRKGNSGNSGEGYILETPLRRFSGGYLLGRDGEDMKEYSYEGIPTSRSTSPLL